MTEKEQKVFNLIQDAIDNQALKGEGKNKVEKTVPLKNLDLRYKAWALETLKKHPVTPKLLGGRVMLARKPRAKFTLEAMLPPGTPRFPKGGYILKDADRVTHHCFVDEVKCRAKDKPKRTK